MPSVEEVMTMLPPPHFFISGMALRKPGQTPYTLFAQDVLVHIDKHGFGTFVGETARRRRANAAGSTGDDGHFIVQLAYVVSFQVAVVRFQSISDAGGRRKNAGFVVAWYQNFGFPAQRISIESRLLICSGRTTDES